MTNTNGPIPGRSLTSMTFYGKVWKDLPPGTKHKLRWYYELGQRRCHYCGVQLTWSRPASGILSDRDATIDHMVTKSEGGTWDFGNCLVVCSKCNHTRGNMEFSEFVYKYDLIKSDWLLAKYQKAIRIVDFAKAKKQLQKK